MTRAAKGHFGRGLFEFLAALKANNNREWFASNKDRYVRDVEEPMLRFIADLAARLEKVSRCFVADPRRTGGSMFRIYRDTRFSKKKTPFKHAVAAQFSHQARAKDKSAYSGSHCCASQRLGIRSAKEDPDRRGGPRETAGRLRSGPPFHRGSQAQRSVQHDEVHEA